VAYFGLAVATNIVHAPARSTAREDDAMAFRDIKPQTTSQSMTPQGRNARVAWLTKLGVPAPFHDAIIDAPNDWRSAGGGAIIGVVMVVVVIGVMVAAFMGLNAYVNARATAVAAETAALLVYVDVGLGPLVLLFALIALMGWAGSAAAQHHRVNGFPSSAASMLNEPPKQSGNLVRWLMLGLLTGPVRRAAREATTVDAFLLAMAGRMVRPWRIAAIVLLPPAVALTALETNSFWVAGLSGIEDHRMFPPLYSRHYDIGDAKTLTTGCDHIDDNDWFIYKISLPDGEEFNLGRAVAVEGTTLVAIEAIDVKFGSRFEHRLWEAPARAARDSLAPLCLGHWVKQFDSDGRRRLAKLLHVTAR
jgi:hypothetical protein